MKNESEAHTWMNCKQCLESVPHGESPSTWARLNVGLTDTGIEIWCVRHDHVVARLDFDELVHRALHPECDECAQGIPHESGTAH